MHNITERTTKTMSAFTSIWICHKVNHHTHEVKATDARFTTKSYFASNFRDLLQAKPGIKTVPMSSEELVNNFP